MGGRIVRQLDTLLDQDILQDIEQRAATGKPTNEDVALLLEEIQRLRLWLRDAANNMTYEGIAFAIETLLAQGGVPEFTDEQADLFDGLRTDIWIAGHGNE